MPADAMLAFIIGVAVWVETTFLLGVAAGVALWAVLYGQGLIVGQLEGVTKALVLIGKALDEQKSGRE